MSSLFDPAADYALDRLMTRVAVGSEDITAQWHRPYDGLLVRALPTSIFAAPPGQIDLFVARPGEALAEFEERASGTGEIGQDSPDHAALRPGEVKNVAPLALPASGEEHRLFELAAADQGTARDPITFAAIAADYLRTGPPGVALGHHDQHHLNANFRGAMEDASNMPTHLDTLAELLESLPRDVRGALDFNRSGDAEIIKFGAYLAQHRVGPERRALERFTVGPDRSMDRGADIGR